MKGVKKIFAFCAIFVAVVSCTALLIDAIAADTEPKRAPSDALSEQADAVEDGEMQFSCPGVNLPASETGEDIIRGELEVKLLLKAFGKNLQKVSLLAPEDQVVASIEENYGDYVVPELLQRWKADPLSAPGRLASSPWPDRIDILSMEMIDETRYAIYGEIIEVTGVELERGGAAAKRPVAITVEKLDGRWLISDLKLGEYPDRGPVVYENTRYGFCFYLPGTWEGFSVVEEQWTGIGNGEIAETGPQILIRHPEWTEETSRQDIPIMVFTHEQWDALRNGSFSVGAAPVGPTKLGSNSKYVFALPARYNYAFPIGYEEVEEILKGNPLWPYEVIK